MKILLATLINLATSIGMASSSQSDSIQSLQWLTGDWGSGFSNNKLELNFSSTSGGVILSTYKILSPQKDLIFMRFLSIIESNGQLQLHLYPFLNASPDVFVAEVADSNKVVFTRLYSNELCHVDQSSLALQDDEEKQMACDRFPIEIHFTKTSDSSFEEHFYGFKPKDGKQTDVSFSRTYEKN